MVQSLDEELCEIHAGEAAFLWTQRMRAVRDPLYDTHSLAELDERVEAHLDGLRLLGSAGWEVCLAALSEAGAGEVFAASAMAADREDLEGFASVLDIAGADAQLSVGIAGGLAWLSFERVKPLLRGLLSHRCPPPLLYVGISACAQHRRDPGEMLAYAIESSDIRLRARAMEAVGELLRRDLRIPLRAHYAADELECRFWSAHSGAMLGDEDAVGHLRELALSDSPFAEKACAAAVRHMKAGQAHEWLQTLIQRSGCERAALSGAAALGDPSLGPWLLSCLRRPELARRAGFALSMISGLDIRGENMATDAPEGFESGPNDDPEDEDVMMDPDESLPWPDADSIGMWWKQEEVKLKRGTRYLLGKPMVSEWLSQVMALAHQPARAAAAMELCLMGQEHVFSNVERPLWNYRAWCPASNEVQGISPR